MLMSLSYKHILGWGNEVVTEWFNCSGACVCESLVCRLSESNSFYRFVPCWLGHHNLFFTSVMFGFCETVKTEGLWTRPLCLSVHYKGMLRMTERTAHITYRCHYITELCCIVFTRQMTVWLHGTFQTLKHRDGSFLLSEVAERERAKTGLPECVWTVNPGCKGAATHLCD